MIRDINLNFDTALAIAVTATSTNVIDLGAKRDLGPTEPLAISAIVTTGFAGGISLAVAVQGSPDDATWTTLLTGEAVPVASLVEGAQIANYDVPHADPVGLAPYRYLRLQYIVVGTMTGGALTSDLVSTKSSVTNYPPGFAYTAPAVQTFVTS